MRKLASACYSLKLILRSFTLFMQRLFFFLCKLSSDELRVSKENKTEW